MRTIVKYLAVLLFLLPGHAFAGDPAVIGTSRSGGATYNIALAIAKAAKADSGTTVLATPFKSVTQALPLVDRGELTMGVGNAIEISRAIRGEAQFRGREHQNLRLIAALYPIKISVAVRSDSKIQSFGDLKGMRVPAGFKTSTIGQDLITAILAGGGIGIDEVTQVEVSDFNSAVDEFIAGNVDVMFSMIGSGRDVRISEKVGGIRILGLADDEDSLANMRKSFPISRRDIVLPAEGVVGIDKPIRVLAYDFYLYTHKEAPADIVRAVAEALLDQRALLIESVPAFKWFAPARIASDVGIAYHPAALELYKSRGLVQAQ